VRKKSRGGAGVTNRASSTRNGLLRSGGPLVRFRGWADRSTTGTQACGEKSSDLKPRAAEREGF